jgi:uncharacterized protein YukE
MQYADVEEMRQRAREIASAAQEISLISDSNTADLENLDWSGAASDKYKQIAHDVYYKIGSLISELEDVAVQLTNQADQLENRIREEARSGIME